MLAPGMDLDENTLQSKVDQTKKVIEEVNKQFMNPVCSFSLELTVRTSQHLFVFAYQSS